MTTVLLPQISRATRSLLSSTVHHRCICTATAASFQSASCSATTSRNSIQDMKSSEIYLRRSNSRLTSTSVSLRHSSSSSSSSTASSSKPGGASTDASVNQKHYPDDEHVLDKGDTLDIQSDNSVKGRDSRAQDSGGHATTEKDVRSNAERAKKEYPEAPDTVIGMQDERGGKGY